MAYETYKILFRVILFYGVDVEKILGLFCLKRFCQVKEINCDIFKDRNLIDHLNSLLVYDCAQGLNKKIKERLHISINEFLSLELDK